jgi:hypothetical protein
MGVLVNICQIFCACRGQGLDIVVRDEMKFLLLPDIVYMLVTEI